MLVRTSKDEEIKSGIEQNEQLGDEQDQRPPIGVADDVVQHCGTKPGRFKKTNNSLSHELGSEGVSERVSAARE